MSRVLARCLWRVINAMRLKRPVLSTVDAMQAGDGVVEIGRAELTLQAEGQPTSQVAVK